MTNCQQCDCGNLKRCCNDLLPGKLAGQERLAMGAGRDETLRQWLCDSGETKVSFQAGPAVRLTKNELIARFGKWGSKAGDFEVRST